MHNFKSITQEEEAGRSEFEASLVYKASSRDRLQSYTVKPCLKKQNKTKSNKQRRNKTIPQTKTDKGTTTKPKANIHILCGMICTPLPLLLAQLELAPGFHSWDICRYSSLCSCHCNMSFSVHPIPNNDMETSY